MRIDIELDPDKMSEEDKKAAITLLRTAFHLAHRQLEEDRLSPGFPEWRRLRERIWDLRTDRDVVEKINDLLFP